MSCEACGASADVYDIVLVFEYYYSELISVYHNARGRDRRFRAGQALPRLLLMFPTSQVATAPLSLQGAHLINAALTLGYVLPLYFTKYTRLSFTKTSENDGKGPSGRWRDDPAVIKARLLSVSLSTIASLCLVGYIISTGPSKVSMRHFESRVAHKPCRVDGIQLLSSSGFLWASAIYLRTS